MVTLQREDSDFLSLKVLETKQTALETMVALFHLCRMLSKKSESLVMVKRANVSN